MQQEPNELVKYAVLEIARYINQDKLAPQDALGKVAKELDLNPNFIKRASEGINVALHYNHFKKHANERELDFPITDASQVVKDIFGSKEKTASEHKAESFSPNHYEDNQINFAKILTNPAYKEAYLKILNTDAKDTSFEMSFKGVCEKSANYIQRLEKEVDHLQTEKVGAHMQVTSLFSKMVNEFSKEASARIPFDEFESQVYSTYGELATPYLDLIHKTANISEPRGVHDNGYKMFTPSYLTNTFGAFLKSAEQAGELDYKVKEAEENVEFERSYVKEAYKKYAEAKLESKVAESEDLKKNEILDTDDPVLKKAHEKMAADSKDASKAFGVFSPLINAIRQGPGSNGKLDNLHRKLMLQELLATDPIISKMPAEQVVNGYHQMMSLAPDLSREKEVVRSTLRLLGSSQAMTPYDAQQLISTNTDLMKQKMLSSGEIQPKA